MMLTTLTLTTKIKTEATPRAQLSRKKSRAKGGWP